MGQPAQSESIADEITAGNALLVASLADRAVSRYMNYKELTSTLSGHILFYQAPLPPSAPCRGGGSQGSLAATNVSATSFAITLNQCVTFLGVNLKSGVVGVDQYARLDEGNQFAYESQPRGIELVDESGTDIVSGSVAYGFLRKMTPELNTATHAHEGRLEFRRGAKTDVYRNLNASWTEATDHRFATYTLKISNLELATGRAAVSEAGLAVTTPEPIVLDTQAGSISGSIAAASRKDGSRVQYDYLGINSVRLRLWDSKGALVLDETKTDTDADVLAAEDAAAN